MTECNGKDERGKREEKLRKRGTEQKRERFR